MEIRRGCGCPVLLLGLVDLVMVVACIVGMVTGVKGATMLGVVLFLAIFLGNTAVCALIAMAAFRVGVKGGGLDAADSAAEWEPEGEDSVDA